MSVVLATGAAAFAMAATAAVSVLADERMAAVEGGYRQPLRMGKHSVRAEGTEVVEACMAVPFPDACVVREVPREELPLMKAAESIKRWVPKVRPLHEAVEVPENFV